VTKSHRKALYVATSVGLILSGLAAIFGPGSGTGYAVVKQVPGGIRTWGVAFAAVGLFKLAMLAVYKWGEPIRLGSTLGGFMAWAWALGLACAGHRLGGWTSIPAWFTVGTVQFLGASAALGE
jgi:hypothetical protein